MRAVVLLCLLHAALGSEYNWDGPVRVAPVSDPNGNNACGSDELTCGCCAMLRQVNMMRTHFDTKLTELEKEVTKTDQTLNNMEANRTAFTVSLYSDEGFRCYGPFGFNNIIVYKNVFLNKGGAYNMNTGIFTAPVSGVYSIALTIYSDAGSPGNLLAACVTLQVNGQAVAGAKELNTMDQEDSATIAVALQLTATDKVTVNLTKGCFLCDDSNYNTFSAFLLYATQ
ncbi:cerebellin-3-like [Mugil cephalus]|uniref:cerebellin-3-like n=1 Tax=Mugil cephalus TaxID=48193 RepID=UPI001FB6D813|nr:cerebellin-3-like [Mugil cephalus]